MGHWARCRAPVRPACKMLLGKGFSCYGAPGWPFRFAARPRRGAIPRQGAGRIGQRRLSSAKWTDFLTCTFPGTPSSCALMMPPYLYDELPAGLIFRSRSLVPRLSLPFRRGHRARGDLPFWLHRPGLLYPPPAHPDVPGGLQLHADQSPRPLLVREPRAALVNRRALLGVRPDLPRLSTLALDSLRVHLEDHLAEGAAPCRRRVRDAGSVPGDPLGRPRGGRIPRCGLALSHLHGAPVRKPGPAQALGSAFSSSLLAGVLLKYTVCGLMPPAALLLGVALVRRVAPGRRLRWAAVGTLALALPAGVTLLEMRELERRGSVTDRRVATAKGRPPSSLAGCPRPRAAQRRRGAGRTRVLPRQGLRAPEVQLPGAPSPLGGHGPFSSSSSRPLLTFQPTGTRGPASFQRARSAGSQALQQWSVRWCLGFSALAVVGTLLCSGLAGWSLAGASTEDFRSSSPRSRWDSTQPCSFRLHRLLDPYTPGFWLPRLVLPAVVVFYALGFELEIWISLARPGAGRKLSRALGGAFAGYTLVACALFAGILL